MQMLEFNEKGLEVQRINFSSDNQRYNWEKMEYDSLGRIIKKEHHNTTGLIYVIEFTYLPNGDCTEVYKFAQNNGQDSFYKHFFDQNGNEILREEYTKESQLLQRELKTYNPFNRILAEVHRHVLGDTVLLNRYYYKRDTVLVRTKTFIYGELQMRAKYTYFPNGKEKLIAYRKHSRKYSSYDEHGRLSQTRSIPEFQNDTIYSDYTYDEKGRIHSKSDYRHDHVQARVVYTYENAKERTKTNYVGQRTVSSVTETVYFGDTAIVIYFQIFPNKKANYAHYKRLDSHGNVLSEVAGDVKGTKQPLNRWMKNLQAFPVHLVLNPRGKVLAKYRIVEGWFAESNICRNYSDTNIMKSLSRGNQSVEYPNCKLMNTISHPSGTEYVVSMISATDLTRHIYTNKNGEVDSILDINTAGTVLNRMIQKDGVKLTYSLTDRYEYNELDSLVKTFDREDSFDFGSDEDMIEEQFWENGRKVKIERFRDPWTSYNPDFKTTVTFEYSENDVLKTTTDPHGKITTERMSYDENGRLTEIMQKSGGGAVQITFRYDAAGNLLERTETIPMNPSTVEYLYEFW